MERRSLVNGGLAAGVAALVAPVRAEAAAGAAAGGDDADRIVGAIGSLHSGVERMFRSAATDPWLPIERIRKVQHDWLKAHQKYPDFVEVGLAVWDGMHDWHVRHQHPLNITRLDDGRYAMAFMFTTLLLRYDLQPDWIGFPFDLDRRPAAQ